MSDFIINGLVARATAMIVGLLVSISGPAKAAIGVEHYGFSRVHGHGFDMPVDSDYFSRSEYSGRMPEEMKWRNGTIGAFNRTEEPHARERIIIENFAHRGGKPLEIRVYNVFGGEPITAPLRTLTSDMHGAPLWRLPEKPSVTVVPLPPTLPLMAFALAGFAVLRRVRRGAVAA